MDIFCCTDWLAISHKLLFCNYKPMNGRRMFWCSRNSSLVLLSIYHSLFLWMYLCPMSFSTYCTYHIYPATFVSYLVLYSLCPVDSFIIIGFSPLYNSINGGFLAHVPFSTCWVSMQIYMSLILVSISSGLFGCRLGFLPGCMQIYLWGVSNLACNAFLGLMLCSFGNRFCIGICCGQ